MNNSVSGFLNDSEVDNILRQMPPPPPKYEEIPSGFTVSEIKHFH